MRQSTAPPSPLRRTLAALVGSTLALMGVTVAIAGPGAPAASAATSPRAAALVAAWNGARWISDQLDAAVPLSVYGAPDWGATLDAGVALGSVDRAFGRPVVGADPMRAEVWAALVANREAAVTVKGADDPGRLAKAILFTVSELHDPRAVGTGAGADLVARLLATMRGTGADAGLFGAGDPTYDGAYRQGLALRALAVAGATLPPVAVAWLEAQQCADGSWQGYRSDPAVACVLDLANYTGPDTNSTASALAGLSNVDTVDPDRWGDAVDWLVDVRNTDGGWGYFEGDPTDANSTASVLSILGAADLDAYDLSAPALTALALPCDAEAGGGAFQFSAGDGSADLMATVQGVNALVLDGLTVQAAQNGLGVPAQDCTTVQQATTTTTTTTTAPGGSSTTTSAPAASTTAALTTTSLAAAAEAQVAGTSTETGGASGADPTALAVTGAAPLGPTLAGSVAVGLGLLLSVLARRRRTTTAPVGTPR